MLFRSIAIVGRKIGRFPRTNPSKCTWLWPSLKILSISLHHVTWGILHLIGVRIQRPRELTPFFLMSNICRAISDVKKVLFKDYDYIIKFNRRCVTWVLLKRNLEAISFYNIHEECRVKRVVGSHGQSANTSKCERYTISLCTAFTATFLSSNRSKILNTLGLVLCWIKGC